MATNELAWRRSWKPSLQACPWQPLNIDGKKYLIKTRFSQDSYEIMVTDLVNFWYEELEDPDLMSRVKELNPSVQATAGRVLDQIRNGLENEDRDHDLSIKHTKDDNIVLCVNSELAGLPFSWKFKCCTADKSMVSENLIIPLIAMIGELGRRQKELVKIINTKDKEIDDYKSQGAKTSRKHIETNEFVETAFENSMLMSKEFTDQVMNLGDAAFTEDKQDLYRQIMAKHAWLHSSPSKVTGKGDVGNSTGSSSKSPGKKTPGTSPAKSDHSSPGVTPAKDTEMMRRQALERRLESEAVKKEEKTKKKKKIAF